MDALLQILSPFLIYIIIFIAIIFVLFSLVFVIATFQGREIVLWPPKIGVVQKKTEMLKALNNDYLSIKTLENIVGEWLEIIQNTTDRKYSIGTFKIDDYTKKLVFDGVNFKNNGDVYCTWKSQLVNVNFQKRQIEYIFDAYTEGNLISTNTGFGVIYLSTTTDGMLKPENGYYIEAKLDGKPYTHSMQDLSEELKKNNFINEPFKNKQFYKKIISEFDNKITQTK